MNGTNDCGIEHVEASVKFKGFETRIAKILEPTFVDIQHQTEIAAKKALKTYDFETIITHEINSLIQNETKQIVQDILNRKIREFLPDIEESVIEKLKEKLNE